MDTTELPVVETTFVSWEELKQGLFLCGFMWFESFAQDGVPGVMIGTESRTTRCVRQLLSLRVNDLTGLPDVGLHLTISAIRLLRSCRTRGSSSHCNVSEDRHDLYSVLTRSKENPSGSRSKGDALPDSKNRNNPGALPFIQC